MRWIGMENKKIVSCRVWKHMEIYQNKQIGVVERTIQKEWDGCIVRDNMMGS